jgi:hypothetical protein
MQNNFLGKFFQENFLQRNFLQRNFSQQNFLEPYAVNVYKNFIMGVSSIGKKVKEVEEDARRRFCDYPSA